eukprot:TRINITY_DN1188_c0_g1_i1.p1 TRINITY_DN1188_c0_g1~~TRINITY_DN1188_c0_g1_i1.p1  ORF type:complete len:398 (-),score=30.37 TRINITY_DN1188_c0_g1_i1:848-2041(-)
MLNHDVLHLIYESLSVRDLILASRVCKLWHAASKKDKLWQKHYTNSFDPFGRTPSAGLNEAYRERFIAKLNQITAFKSCPSPRLEWTATRPKLSGSSTLFCCGQNVISAFTSGSSYTVTVNDVCSGAILHTRSWEVPLGFFISCTAHTLDQKWLFTMIGSVFHRLDCTTLTWASFDLPEFRHTVSMFPLSEKSIIVVLNTHGHGPSRLCRVEVEEGRASWNLKDWPSHTTHLFNSNYLVAWMCADPDATYTVDPVDGWSKKARNEILSGTIQLVSPGYILHNHSYVLELPKCLTAIELPKLPTIVQTVIGGCLLYQVTIDRKVRIVSLFNPKKPEPLAQVKWPVSDTRFAAATADDCGNIIVAFLDRIEKWSFGPQIGRSESSTDSRQLRIEILQGP